MTSSPAADAPATPMVVSAAPPSARSPPTGPDAASPPDPPAVPAAKIPSLARRLTIGALRLIPLILIFIVIPYVGLQALAANGLGSALPLPTVTAFGAVLSILSTARYVLRPTRAYGPLSMTYSAAAIAYFLYFAGFASVHADFQQVGVEILFGGLLTVLAVVPLFGLAAGAVTTVEDLRHPGERLPYDYPA